MAFRTAIIIAGFLRTWEHTRDSFKKFLASIPGEVDLYLHCYSQSHIDGDPRLPQRVYTRKEIETLFLGLPVKGLVVDNFNQTNARLAEEGKDYLSVDYANLDAPLYGKTVGQTKTVQKRLGQIWGIQQAYNLIPRPEDYNLLVKTRYDVLYFTVPKNWEALADGKLHHDLGGTGGYPPDVVLVGTPEVMKAICSCYDDLPLLFDPTVVPGGNSCECGNVLPCCKFCFHAMITNRLMENRVSLGIPVCRCVLLRYPGIVDNIVTGKEEALETFRFPARLWHYDCSQV